MCVATAVTGMKALAASAMKLHLIGTLESITFPHKQKALTMEHINIPLIILNIKSGVETASVPWTCTANNPQFRDYVVKWSAINLQRGTEKSVSV